MVLTDFSFLEQQDFIEFERKEQTLRYVEQVMQIYATARDRDQAKALVQHLKDEMFIGHAALRASKTQKLSDDLVAAVQGTYSITQAGGQAILEVSND